MECSYVYQWPWAVYKQTPYDFSIDLLIINFCHLPLWCSLILQLLCFMCCQKHIMATEARLLQRDLQFGCTIFQVRCSSRAAAYTAWYVIRIRIRIYLLARRNLLWDVLRLPSSHRAALGLYVIFTLWRGRGTNQPPLRIPAYRSSPRYALRHGRRQNYNWRCRGMNPRPFTREATGTLQKIPNSRDSVQESGYNSSIGGY